MADKIFTATHLNLSRVSCEFAGDVHHSSGTTVVHVESLYQYCDSGDDVIPQLGRKTVRVQDEIGNLPANIQTALQDLEIYMNGLAVTQEGM